MDRKIWIACLALATLSVLGAARPATACMTAECPPWQICPDVPGSGTTALASGLVFGGDTYITFLGGDRALIQVGIYTTPQMSITYACSTAFPVVEGVERIDGVRLVNIATGQTLPNYQWVQNEASVDEFASIARNEGSMSRADSMQWQGFFTRVENGSVGGIRHAFVFEVKLKPGTTPRQLVSALRRQGAVANGSANFDGSLDFAHYYLRRVGDGRVHVVFAGRDGAAQRRPVVREH